VLHLSVEQYSMVGDVLSHAVSKGVEPMNKRGGANEWKGWSQWINSSWDCFDLYQVPLWLWYSFPDSWLGELNLRGGSKLACPTLITHNACHMVSNIVSWVYCTIAVVLPRQYQWLMWMYNAKWMATLCHHR